MLDYPIVRRVILCFNGCMNKVKDIVTPYPEHEIKITIHANAKGKKHSMGCYTSFDKLSESIDNLSKQFEKTIRINN